MPPVPSPGVTNRLPCRRQARQVRLAGDRDEEPGRPRLRRRDVDAPGLDQQGGEQLFDVRHARQGEGVGDLRPQEPGRRQEVQQDRQRDHGDAREQEEHGHAADAVEHGGDVVAAGRELEAEPQDDQGEAQHEQRQGSRPDGPAVLRVQLPLQRVPLRLSVLPSSHPSAFISPALSPALPRVRPW